MLAVAELVDDSGFPPGVVSILVGAAEAGRALVLCGVVVPRPIALVTTLDENGKVNAAPFSFFNVFSEDPPLIVLGLQHKADQSPKDTTRNIHRSGQFVVHMVDEALAATMNDCAIDFPSGNSEVESSGAGSTRRRRHRTDAR